MIQIKYDLKKDLQRVCLSGHAGYALHGSDIVCAAVSSLFFALHRVLYENDLQFSHSFENDEKFIECKDERANGYFEMFICGVKGISERYPGNVRIFDNK